MAKSQPNMVKVMYIGPKERCWDNMAGSGKAWMGKGDIQEVTEDQAEKLFKFPSVWIPAEGEDGGLALLKAEKDALEKAEAERLAEEEAEKLRLQSEGNKPAVVMVGDKSLDDLTMDEMLEFAEVIELRVDGRWKEPGLREAIRERCIELNGPAE